ncbi:MAG: class I SAM-dependent methyltransferase [Candidatus Diapherotrites archaeon]|nr:class I SAM-dependent methyltransferase [Candidatus Diapherotrites archaeon]
MEPYKEETKQAYELYPEIYEKKSEIHFRNFVRPLADAFISHLRGRTIIDLGSGPGTHAEYFYHKGLDVMCVDYSPEMLKRCAAKGVRTQLADIEEFRMPPNTVDGVWAYTSLLHIQKENIPQVIRNISDMLKGGGLLGVAFFGGYGEKFIEVPLMPGVKRWYSFFTDAEARSLFNQRFDVLEGKTAVVPDGKVYLNYLFRKRPG